MKTPKVDTKYSYQIKNQLYPSIPEIEPKTQMKKSHSSFFEPSYIDKLKRRKERSNSYNSSIIHQDNLNTLLCKLKNYYNEVQCIIQSKQNEIDKQREDNGFLSFQLNQIINFQDIDLPDEKISVKNFNTLKVSKEQLESKIRSFVKEKSELGDVLKNEIEYAKTIEHMHQKEKENLKAISDEIAITEEKIQAINVFRRNIDINVIEQQKKQSSYAQIISKINEDMDLIDTVIEDQTKKSTGLDKTINKKEQECLSLKSQIKAAQKLNNEVVQREKEEIQNKIAYTNELIKIKYIKEQSYIKTILCLNFIQKYFLTGDNDNYNNDSSNRSNLTESKEYKEFLNDKIIIFDENFNVIFEPQAEKEEAIPEPIKITLSVRSMKAKFNPNKSFQLAPSSSMYSTAAAVGNPLTMTIRSNTPSHLKPLTVKGPLRKRSSFISLSQMTLTQLKQKFDEINITRNDLFQYYYRITDRIRFYRNDLIKLNDEQIHLENKKEINSRKVKEIIIKDYKNFDDLIKHNSRFKAFIERNDKLIVASRNRHEISKINNIHKGFNEPKTRSFKLKDVNKSNEHSGRKKKHSMKLTPNSIEVSSHDLYIIAGQVLRETKNFFEGIYTTIRRANASLGDKNNEQYKKIERMRHQLSAHKQDSFEQYVMKLIDFITSDERLSTLVNTICGEDTLTKLKEDIFINGSSDQPNEEFIDQLLTKNLHNQNELFAFLNDKRKAIKAFKSAFTFKLNKESEGDTCLVLPASPKKELKDLYQGKNIYLSKMKSPGKAKIIRNQRDTISNHDDSYSDKDTTLTDNKTTKKKNNSVDQKIIKKLYEPVLVKTLYNRRLNNNMSVIKGLTRSNSKANYTLRKKRQEVDEMSNSLLIYNNRKINVNDLSNSSYNTMVKYVVSNQASKIWKTKEYQ